MSTDDFFLSAAADRLPSDTPFTRSTARSCGVTGPILSRLVAAGYLRHPMRDVYIPFKVPDSLEMRAQCLRLVVPEGCVVTDRTAGWLLGCPSILAPNEHLEVPAVSAYCKPGNRLRNPLTVSGERTLLERDVIEVDGVLVTTPLRTAVDLGRLLSRDHAIAALDGMLRLGGFTREELLDEICRFKGYRGVCQVRVLGPIADPRAESPGESVLRLRWLDASSYVRPEPQVPIIGDTGMAWYWLDLGSRELLYAAEYDGEQWHGPQQTDGDNDRRGFIREECGWIIDVFRRHQVYGRRETATQTIYEGLIRARKRLGRRSPWT